MNAVDPHASIISAPSRAYAIFPRRLLALALDAGLLWLGLLAIIFVVVALGSNFGGVVFWAGIALLTLYEPVLVSATGRTVGHRLANLRVEREDGARLGFWRAVARSGLKAILGFFSFFFMMITQRHQALHDRITRSVVLVHDLERAKPFHYVAERPDPVGDARVSARRRIAITVVWSIAVFLFFAVVPWPGVSEACKVDDVCSGREDALANGYSFALLIGLGALVVLGWYGKLPGARAGGRTDGT